MNDKIYPIAYRLMPGQMQTLHYLSFPAAWKATLLEIAQKNNPKFKDEYGLPTNALKKLVESWMEGIIALAPLKKYSDDARWLTSCRPYTEQDMKALCGIIKIWVMATYTASPKASPLVKKLAHDFCEMVHPEELNAGQSKADVCLTLEDGTVVEEAYQAIPLLVINRLLGKEIILSGQPLRLCYSGKNQLISQPIFGGKNQHQYAFVFDFSVQTTPPQRKALLLCQMSIRRWISDSINHERIPYVAESINAHIKVSEDKYCQVPISYSSEKKQSDWKRQDKKCYNIWGYEPLPLAVDVLRCPSEYASQILLPYKNGMSGFVTSKIGTGVPVVDKAALYQEIEYFLNGMICEQPEAQRIRLKNQKIAILNSPQDYGDTELFRNWVCKCAETRHIVFELYGLWSDPVQQLVLNRLKEKISLDFGENTSDSCLEVEILCKEIGSLADAMIDSTRPTQIQRCEQIFEELGSTDVVTGCIFALPGPEYYNQGDPKQVLRNAFARTGRVVQFINPSDDNENKIENAVYDLYRQLGVVTLLDVQNSQPRYASVPCVGMHICTQIHGTANRARFLPVYVIVDVLNGKTRVQCDAFSNREVSYREACLEMAQLFWKNNLEQRCVNAIRSPAKQKLLELKNHYNQKNDAVLLVVQSDGNTRALWSGISDKEIGSYSAEEEYCPVQINAGMPKNPIGLFLQSTGVRIIRIRSNQEVPDYFTELSAKSSDERIQYASTSGIFKYGSVFWGIHERKVYDLQYVNSFKSSRINYPADRFAEKDMIELYPLQLQSGDNATEWIFYANALRHIPIQYNQSTVLPLPLHLAKRLEEYLFCI